MIIIINLKDRGWYSVNWDNAQFLAWGYKKGCSFVDGPCSQWTYAQGACSTDEDQSGDCTLDGIGKGSCGIVALSFFLR